MRTQRLVHGLPRVRRTARAVLLCAAWAAAACAPDQPKGVSVVMAPDPIDFGNVPWLDSPRHPVTITNRSDHEVMLRNARFTCSCFGIMTPLPPALRPGASSTFDVQMWSRMGTPGRFQKKLIIDTDDPMTPTLETPVIGTITDFRSVTPSQVLLGTLDADSDPVAKTVEVRGGSGYSVQVAAATVSDRRLTAEVKPVASGSDVVVRTVAKSAKGFVSAQVRLDVDVGAPDGGTHRYTEIVRVSGEFK